MFRVILDLSYFFQNHKRKARVFIKENIKTVQDLQKRIEEIFSVKNFELYASEGHCFLPCQEDIRVLSKDEVVLVVPKDKNESIREFPGQTESSTIAKKIKKYKRPLEIIAEENSDELCSPNKKKTKENDVISTPKEELPRKKKKKKHDKKDILENVLEEYLAQKKSKSKKDTDSDPPTVSEKPKTIEKPKSLNSFLPTLKSHINSCDTTGRHVSYSAATTSVHLSNHIDTPYKKFKKLEPVPTITDEVLNKKKINIVKIDIIKQGEEVQINERKNNLIAEKITTNLEENSHLESLSFSTPKSDFVKKVVSYIESEKFLSPENELFNKNKEKSTNYSQEKNQNCNITRIDSEPMELEMSNKFRESDQISNFNSFQIDEKPHSKNELESSEHTRTSLWSISLNNSNKSTQDFSESKMYGMNNSSEIPEKSALLPITEKPRTNFDALSNMSLIEQRDNLKTSVPENMLLDYSLIHSARSPMCPKSGDKSVDPKASALTNENINILFNSDKSSQNQTLENSLDSDWKTSIDTTNESGNNLSSDIVKTPSLLMSNKDSIRSGTSPFEPKNFFYMKRKLAGVASCLEQLKSESDPPISAAEPDSSSIKDLSSSNFVTKRQRKRVRHRRSKKTSEPSPSNSDASFSMDRYVPKPLNVSGCPKIHVKFTTDDEEEESSKTVDDKEDKSTKTVELEEQSQSTEEPKNEENHLEEPKETKKSLNMFPKSLFSENTILKSPIMLTLEPKEGDIIAFKTLAMRNFNPVISDYIVGKVLEFSAEKVVQFEILSHNAMDLQDEEENSNIKQYLWQKLIAPRLIFP